MQGFRVQPGFFEMIIRYALLAALGTVLAAAVPAQQAPALRAPVIRQVDQLQITSVDPDGLFRIFTETLELPVVWPLTRNQQYVTGAFSTGNLTVEIYRYEGTQQSPAAHFSGIIFEPYPMDYVLDELKYLRVRHGKPETHVSTLPGGKEGVLWTRVELPSISRLSFRAFLYEYSPSFLRVEVRRKQLGNRLTLNDGGPLGLLGAKEIVIAAADMAKERKAWEQILGKPSSSGTFTAGTGPAIRVVGGQEDRLEELVLRVKSLNSARNHLKAEKLQGPGSAQTLLLNSSRIQGLKVRLVE